MKSLISISIDNDFIVNVVAPATGGRYQLHKIECNDMKEAYDKAELLKEGINNILKEYGKEGLTECKYIK